MKLVFTLPVVCLAISVMTACSQVGTTNATTSQSLNPQSLSPTSSNPKSSSPTVWDPKAAASYLDQRQVTWMGWLGAARDHDTFCVSCHTQVTYALARPLLRKTLAEEAPSPNETKLLDNVTKRVRLWNEIGPFYSDEGYGGDRVARSRGTEAVLNAFILNSYDSASYDVPSQRLSETTQAAFRNMWALQQTTGDDKGAWSWLQFGMEPFEAKDSQYYGACLAAVATGMAPESYRSGPEIQANLGMLREYLGRKYATQSTINQVALLWASTKLPGLIEPERRQSIINEVWAEQQTDGGWNLSSLAYPKDWSLHSLVRKHLRSDETWQPGGSDGYATALITFSLQEAGIPASDPRLARGLLWLGRNQDKAEGFWPSVSVNQRRNPSSNVGHFMDDAATGFAVLSLSKSHIAAGKGQVNAGISQLVVRQDPEKK